MSGEDFLVLGGAGLVGFQVAHRIAADLEPGRVVIVARRAESVAAAVARLRELHPGGDFVGEWGDVFVRSDFARRSRADLLEDEDAREGVFDDILGPFDAAYGRSRLAALLDAHRPDVIVDAVNTATAISYQDVYTASVVAKRDVDLEQTGADLPAARMARDVEELILSQSVPQLIRHVRILNRAMREAGTRLYLKVGTTGTGGMGFNIPYTHSEDRPSARLMTKTAVAFAHTGLLFLMARTPGGPLAKEIKPAALIAYADVAHRTIREGGEPVARYTARPVELGDRLELRLDPDGFTRLGELVLPVVDTGENGVFTRGEFEAISAPGQMEFVTPEEIATLCVQEISGGNTGRDVVGALDASILGPSYRGGIVRREALERLRRLEHDGGTHSVALGQLGPPELSKLLWEAELLVLGFGTVSAVLEATAGEVAARCAALVADQPGLADTMTSLGLPILDASGTALWRGPHIRIPEVPGETAVAVTPDAVDRWAGKGWIDLRPANWERWRHRFAEMRRARPGTVQPGSAGITPEAYLPDTISIGAVVAWVLANELGGYRIK